MKTAHDLVMAAKARTQEVSLDDADEAIRDADVLIDVREADEFAAGHLPVPFISPAACSSSSSAATRT
jgi:rhodanese-related sulfurtransferase